jgi:hypothetical protein
MPSDPMESLLIHNHDGRVKAIDMVVRAMVPNINGKSVELLDVLCVIPVIWGDASCC